MAGRISFKGTLRSVDASSPGLAITLFQPGSAKTIPILAEDEVTVTSVYISAVAATVQVEVYFKDPDIVTGLPTDAESIVRFSTAVVDSMSHTWPTGIIGERGKGLYVNTGVSGAVSVTVTGHVNRRGA